MILIEKKLFSMPQEIWQQEEIINWTQILLDSYKQLLAKELIIRKGSKIEQAKQLFFAPFVVISHGIEADPIYNYGNKSGLILWERSWEELRKTPSRTSAEPLLREERQQLLTETKNQEYVINRQAIRISKTGKKYQINDITIWNLYNQKNKYCGQAATFSDWILLN
jgi:hypothetical protein